MEGNGAEREGERIPSRPRSVSREPNAGLKLTNCEIMTWAEIKSQMLNWLSHPGAPTFLKNLPLHPVSDWTDNHSLTHLEDYSPFSTMLTNIPGSRSCFYSHLCDFFFFWTLFQHGRPKWGSSILFQKVPNNLTPQTLPEHQLKAKHCPGSWGGRDQWVRVSVSGLVGRLISKSTNDSNTLWEAQCRGVCTKEGPFRGRLGGSVGWASDFSSDHDLAVCEFEPHVGLCADSSEPGACSRFCVPLSHSAPPRLCSVSVFQKWMNI